mmetsp:Transcript_27755/g.51668  ORF Transcript_27755/g.51668 Transcript_27755/m.51668 type:complete len:159 (-) Transcript_27755:106-582(-)
MTHFASRHFIAAIAAAAISITGFSAAPARAGEDDLGKALAALAGLAVLGVVIKNSRDDKKAKPHIPGDRIGRDIRTGVHPRPLPPRVGHKLLPQRCLRSVQGRDGRLRVFGERCLERHYHYTHRLPERCGTRFRTDRGVRYGYGARCLSRHGFQLARH